MKATILLVMHITCIIGLSAQQSEGPRPPRIFQSQDCPGFSQTWINTGDIAYSDDTYSTFGNLAVGGTHTNYLVATNFSFNIPDGATINGIRVDVECSDPNNRTSDYSVRIVQKNIISGQEMATGAAYPSSDAYMTYGGSTNLWGLNWTHKDINDEGFGIAIAAQRTTNLDFLTTEGRIDNIVITVYYTHLFILPVNLVSFTGKKEGAVVRLNWKSTDESNLQAYEIERSSNGINFQKLQTVAALNQASAAYTYVDQYPVQGLSYYRLNIKEMNGVQKYSQVVPVSFNRSGNIDLFPSPWEKGNALNITNYNNEKLTIYFMNAGGQVLSTVVTDNSLVPTTSLLSRNGILYYKIFDQSRTLVGTGTLIITH